MTLDNLITNYGPIILGVMALFSALFLLKISPLGCRVNLHFWKKQVPKLTGTPKHDYLFRECRHCDCFQTKSEGSSFKWISLGR